MGKSLPVALFAGLLAGCNYGAAQFTCDSTHRCGAGGTCESDSFCSFEDASCPDPHRRYGDLAGPKANKCVGEVEQPPMDGPLVDALPDAPPDAPPDARACFGTGIVQVCLAATPTQPLAISSPTTIDTTNSPMCAELLSGGDYCVVAATEIMISAKLRGIGTRPLVLLASGSVVTSGGGLIDVGSHRILPGRTTEPGAGADSQACAAGMAPAASGGGGGAGGSFFGNGGDGGNGGNGGASGKHGAAVTAISTLRGGCPGQDGNGATGLNGIGGRGGGAVYLIAGVQIDIQGGINAAGEGGAGGAQNVGGGGGGGSGGMIGFDAPTVTCNSLLLASSGAGGGGGGSGTAPTEGGDGQDPATTTAALRGTGFVGNGTAGGNGGDGSVALVNGAGGPGLVGDSGGTNHGGGGGGGGGTGVIKAPDNANLGSTLSPPKLP